MSLKCLTLNKTRICFHDFLQKEGYNKETIRGRLCYLQRFLNFLPGRIDVRNVDLKRLEEFFSSLQNENLKGSTRYEIYRTIKQLFKGLYKQGLILINPMSNFEYRYSKKKSYKESLSEDETIDFLKNIDRTKKLDYRDFILFIFIYSTGLRGSEVSNLKLEDIDFRSNQAFIRKTKNRMQRNASILPFAMNVLKEYLGNRKEGYVFHSRTRGRLSRNQMNARFKEHLRTQGLFKEGLTLHSIRHSSAKHMHVDGMPIMNIKEFLGHKQISSTAVYTELEINEMRKLFLRQHPDNELPQEPRMEQVSELMGAISGRLQSRKSYMRSLRGRELTVS